LRVGDDNKDKQDESILAFDTSAIPDNATIVSVTLRLLRETVSGTNPFGSNGACWVDVQTEGFSGSTSLQTTDFQAAATVVQAACECHARETSEASASNVVTCATTWRTRTATARPAGVSFVVTRPGELPGC
jgi:hypothetical protein